MCGKTSLIQRYANNIFNDSYATTVGADFVRKDVELESGTLARLQLWDLAGQDRFVHLTRTYLRKSHGKLTFII